MKKLLLLLLLLAIISISCTTTKHSSTTRVMDIYGPGVVQLPVVGELDVDINKVSETVTKSGTAVNAEQLKLTAVSRAVKNANADILIEPSFEVSAEGTTTTVIVTGFPATYSEFRSATPEDIPIMEAGQLPKASVLETQEEVSSSENQSNNPLIVITALGGIAGLAYILSGN